MARNMQFIPNFRILEAVAHGNRAAGTSNLHGAKVDMQNDTCICALIEMGGITATAVTSIGWQTSDDDGVTWTEAPDTDVTVAATDDDEYFVSEYHKPLSRWVRVTISRATANAALRSAQYILGGPRKSPTHKTSGEVGAGDGYGTEYSVHQFIGGQGAA